MDKRIDIIDGTQLYSGDIKINDKCLERHYNRGTEEETVNYHVDVLDPYAGMQVPSRPEWWLPPTGQVT